LLQSALVVIPIDLTVNPQVLLPSINDKLIGISPIPGTHIMANCPGEAAEHLLSWTKSVKISFVSFRSCFTVVIRGLLVRMRSSN
jgi:hypothetical protein